MKTGQLRPIRVLKYPKRLPRTGTVKLNGLSLTIACTKKLQREARRRGCSLCQVMSEKVEEWFKRREQGRPLPDDP